MPRYTAPRGTLDVLPEDQPYWRYVTERAHSIAQLYGYQQISTPMFEATELFVRGVGEGTDIVDKEIYAFQDKGGEEIALRPEFTAGIMRAFIQHGMHTLPRPVKLYSLGPIFRYERPQAGRYRQHTQFNVEALGEQDPALDAEIMELARHLYADLGFGNLAFQLNSTGCPQCRPGYVKLLVEHYQGHYGEMCDDCKRRMERNPLRMLDCKANRCQPLIAAAPHFADHLCRECAEHLQTLQSYLRALDRPFVINHRLVRGLDYYTKTVFEVWAEGIGAQAAVCGGGRYDGLIELLGGPSTPGIGFGSGIERIILTMKARGVSVPPLSRPQVLIAAMSGPARVVAIRLIADLRASGVPAVLALGDRSLKSQLREANKQQVIYALILGEDEIKQGQVLVRDMRSSEQSAVPMPDLRSWLGERLGA